MKPKNLLRIKVNNFNLIKLSLINDTDFNFSFPRTNVNGIIADTHFSLHTKNDRVTFKTVSLKDQGKEMLPAIVQLVGNGVGVIHRTSKGELDMGKIINFNNTKILIRSPIGLAVNLQNTSIDKLYINKKTKTPDSDFKIVKNFYTYKKGDQLSIWVLIGKNFNGNLDRFIKRYDDHILIKRKNFLNNEYTLLFLVKYKFPKIKKYNKLVHVAQ